MSQKLSGNFWGEGGSDVVSHFVKSTLKDLKSLQGILLERSLIETEFSRVLSKLSRKVETLEEYGSLKRVVSKVREEVEKESSYHNQIGNELKNQSNLINQKLKGFQKQSKGLLSDAEKLNKEYQSLHSRIASSKLKYKQVYSANAALDSKIRAETDQGKISKLEKERQKGVKQQVSAEQDYQGCIQKLSTYQPQYEEKLRAVFDSLQHLEKQRWEVSKNSINDYNQSVNQLESFYSSSTSEISSLIASSNFGNDLDEWIEQNKKMTSPLQIPKFEAYGTSSTSVSPTKYSNQDEAVKDSVPQQQTSNAATSPISTVSDTNTERAESPESNHSVSSQQSDQKKDEDAEKNIENSNVSNVSGEVYLTAWEYEARESNEISFKANETIKVISKDDQGWWTGINATGQIGLFPANFLEGQ